MPKGRKHYHHFVDREAVAKLDAERRANAANLPLARQPRLMDEFSATELDELQRKLERWIREGTGRIQGNTSA